MERPGPSGRQPSVPVHHPVQSEPSAFEVVPRADEDEEQEEFVTGLEHLSAYEQRTYTYCDGTIHILFKDREFTDVIFICEDGCNVEAHKFILAVRSEYFKDLIYRKGDNLDENSKIKTYNFSGSKLVLEVILEYLYTGQVSEFEGSDGLIDEHTVLLWTSVLKQALEKSFGGLDIYMRALLVRCYASEHHVAASLLTFAMANNLMDVGQAMVNVLLSLPFTDDCLKKMPEEAIEVVLDTVPFQVEETQICRALAEWLKADSMDDDDELGGSTLPPNLLQLIDLKAISMEDVETILDPLQIMDADTLLKVYIMHACSPEDEQIVTGISKSRGTRHIWNSGQASELLNDEGARAAVMSLQQYTTFSGKRPDGTPAQANGRTARPFETIAE